MDSSLLCIEVPRAFLAFSTVLASTVCFTAAVLAVGLWTHHYGPVPVAAWAIRWNNRIYASVSAVMVGIVLQFSVASYMMNVGRASVTTGSLVCMNYSSSVQDQPTSLVALAPLMYHCSKFYEYFDIILVLANHGPNYRSLSQQPINLHFGFHHLTTPYLTWFRIVQSSDPGWEVFAGLNCLHHAIMYSFFGGGPMAGTLRKILPWTGGLQLIAGIAMEIQALLVAESSGDDLLGHWIALGLLNMYLVLYVRDLTQRAEDKTSTVQKKWD